MFEILTRAGCFVAMIFLGWLLRKLGFFGEEAFPVLSRIVLKITLPAAILSSFAGKTIDPGLLTIALLGLGGGLVYMALGTLLGRSGGKEGRAFTLLNLSGYNIGNFALPFVQSFLGPVGVVTTSLFDTGNAFICLGSAYSVAAMVQEGRRFSFLRVGKTLLRSVPFLSYILVLTLDLLHLPLPGPVLELAEIVGGANAFLAMLMLGVGFRLEADRSQLGRIVKILVTRYAFAAVFALGCFFLLPFELEVRQALVLLCFSPIASAAPAFTGELRGDVGLASAVNSLSIVCSIVLMVTLLLFLI